MSRFTPPEHILKIHPYDPGKSESELLRELKVGRIARMDCNENAFGPSPKAVAAMKQASERAHRYPENGGLALRNALAQRLHVMPDHVILGNGSTELLEILSRTYLTAQHNVVTADQTFPVYASAAAAMGAGCRTVAVRAFAYDLESIAAAIDGNTRIVFIANPNNPTGTLLREKQLLEFLNSVPLQTLVVLDEAYLEYIADPEYPAGVDFLSGHPNVILLRTFSKIYGLAGMRLGYGIADPEIISHLNRIRSPYNTSSIAEAGAIAALEDTEHVCRSQQLNLQERLFLEEKLTDRDFRPIPSHANFLFLPLPNAAEVAGKLLKSGVVVRSFPSGLRITIGTHEDNLALLSAL